MKWASDKKYDINDILLLLACILTDHETVKDLYYVGAMLYFKV